MDFIFKCPKCGIEIISDGPENPVCVDCLVNRSRNIKMEREFEIDTDRTAEWESYKRRQMIK